MRLERYVATASRSSHYGSCQQAIIAGEDVWDRLTELMIEWILGLCEGGVGPLASSFRDGDEVDISVCCTDEIPNEGRCVVENGPGLE